MVNMVFVPIPRTIAEDSNIEHTTRLTAERSRPAQNVRDLIGRRVVIVEDEGVTQMQLRRMLKQVGMTVLGSAINGQDGVDIVLRERPDLVLMDIRMPGAIDGLEAARRILAEFHVCIVMLTAFSEDEYRRRAEEIAVADYIVKPVTRDILVPAITAALKRFGEH